MPKRMRTIREPELAVVTNNTTPDLQSEVAELPLEAVEEMLVVEKKVEEKPVRDVCGELDMLGDRLDIAEDILGNDLSPRLLALENKATASRGLLERAVAAAERSAGCAKEVLDGIQEQQAKTAFLEAKVDATAGEASKMAEAHTSAINTHSVIHAITLGALAVLGVVVWKGRTPKA